MNTGSLSSFSKYAFISGELLLNEAPVDIICEAAEIATKFNRDEIPLENIGSEMAKLGL